MIAVLDDDESLSGALEGLLKEAGLPVRLFASAEDFLNSGQRHDTRCLIADIRMPGMSGLDLQAQLKAARHRIPIIFITAHGDERIRLQAMRAGAVDFLTKPFDDGILLEKVRSACLASPVPFWRLNGGDQPESKSLFCLGTMGK